MKVLVTGGSGFIGSHIVDRLVREGVDVRVFDRVERTIGAALPAAGGHRVEIVQGELADRAAVTDAVVGVDAVCHQAARVGLGVDFGDVTSYVASNDLGTAILLEALWRRSFHGRLVLASSMVVYGEGQARCRKHGVVTPGARQTEDLAAGRFEPLCPHPGCIQNVTWVAVSEDADLDPRNVYAATKLHQEHLCTLWGRESGATVVCLRYHNVYGPRMPRDTPYAGVASIFRSALAVGQPPLVFEDGSQTRDFIHVRDVARANVLCLTRPGVRPGPYNIASGVPHTVGELAHALSAAFGSGAPRPMVTGAWRLGDVRHIVASAEKAAAGLGFKAAVTFEEGMAEFAQPSPPAAGVA